MTAEAAVPLGPTAAGVPHLLARVGLVEERVRALVAARRAVDPAPDDPFRGLYLSDAVVDSVLRGHQPWDGGRSVDRRRAEVEAVADRHEATGDVSRLRSMARAFALPDFAVEALLVAVAPDLDARFERLYGYLNDDVGQRRATVRLLFELYGVAPADLVARAVVSPGSTLVDAGLVMVEDADRPFLTRSLRVPDRVTVHLLGGVTVHPELGEAVVPSEPDPRLAVPGIVRALRAGAGLVHVRDPSGSTGAAAAVASLAEAGLAAVRLDLARLPLSAGPPGLPRAVRLEAGLRGAGLVAGPVEALLPDRRTLLRALADLPLPVVLVGSRPWDPEWADGVPACLDAVALPEALRAQLWAEHLDGDRPADLDPVAETAPFTLGPEQLIRAAEAARLEARVQGKRMSGDEVRAGARAQNAGGLARLARRVVPAVTWHDLVLPADTVAGLRDLVVRARHRGRIMGEWRMRPGGGRGTGVTALLTGESGTGKTMAAEVVAGELGLDLFVVDLAGVVDKYVGETEKNLDRVFTEAARVNGVLLFDEADAVFGRRSEVRDAHDRYANVETAYLLQRVETFDGIALLTTNFRGNVDEAFTRRLDLVVDFPRPGVPERLALWDRCLGTALPRHDDVDLAVLADVELSGGEIRAAAVSAAYRAAARGGRVCQADLEEAVDLEYRKQGRLRRTSAARPD